MILTSVLLSLFAGIFYSASTPACTYEDGSELTKPGQVCKWDASTAGNGVGDSFVVTITEDGKPLYIYADGHSER